MQNSLYHSSSSNPSMIPHYLQDKAHDLTWHQTQTLWSTKALSHFIPAHNPPKPSSPSELWDFLSTSAFTSFSHIYSLYPSDTHPISHSTHSDFRSSSDISSSRSFYNAPPTPLRTHSELNFPSMPARPPQNICIEVFIIPFLYGAVS